MNYDEQYFLKKVGPAFYGLYAQIDRKFGDDPEAVVWPARTQADIDNGMSPDASLAKHVLECTIALGLPNQPPAPTPIPPGGGVPTLTNDGRNLVTENGLYRYKGWTDFSLLKLIRDGVDIIPLLQDRVKYGANEVRVLCSMAWDGWQYIPGSDEFEVLAHLADACLSQGLFVEIIPFTGTNLQDTAAKRQEYWLRMVDFARNRKNVNLELINEYDVGKNIDTNEFVFPERVRASHGSGGGDSDPVKPFWNRSTFHPGRANDWPRKMKSAREYDDMGNVPCLVNEPMGADETFQPGRRDNDPNNFFDAGAVAALQINGALFHSQSGLRSEYPGPVQQQCAKAFFEGLGSIPVEARTWRYTRGGLNDCPVEHVDTSYSRLFVQYSDREAWGVAVQPTAAWQLKALRGTVDNRVGNRGNVFHITF